MEQRVAVNISIFCNAGPDINVEIPKDLRVRFLIDSLASYVVSDGCRFEMAAMSAQGANPEFAFLFDLRSSEHAFYRCHHTAGRTLCVHCISSVHSDHAIHSS